MGDSSQFDQTVEECLELALAIRHVQRGRISDVDNMAEEVADVEIMCMQVREIIGHELVDQWKDQKLIRLRCMLDDEERTRRMRRRNDDNPI